MHRQRSNREVNSLSCSKLRTFFQSAFFLFLLFTYRHKILTLEAPFYFFSLRILSSNYRWFIWENFRRTLENTRPPLSFDKFTLVRTIKLANIKFLIRFLHCVVFCHATIPLRLHKAENGIKRRGYFSIAMNDETRIALIVSEAQKSGHDYFERTYTNTHARTTMIHRICKSISNKILELSLSLLSSPPPVFGKSIDILSARFCFICPCHRHRLSTKEKINLILSQADRLNDFALRHEFIWIICFCSVYRSVLLWCLWIFLLVL